MSNLSDEMAKRPCAFLIKIKYPLQTSAAILGILSERDIRVNTINLHNISPEEGILIIHCMIEKDRSRYIMHLMEKLKGVMELELLEGKGTHLFNAE